MEAAAAAAAVAVGESTDMKTTSGTPPTGSSRVRSDGDWISLGTSAKELRLDNTLPTGQSFRWRKTTEGDYVGVIGQRVVSMRQEENDVLYRVHCRPGSSGGESAAASALGASDAEAVADYFNLDVSLEALSQQWAAADVRFKRLEPYLPGCRMLRQDPAECLFSFICSSNNHISRIHGMVERLCAAYGTKLVPDERIHTVRKAVPEKKSGSKNNRTPSKSKSKGTPDGGSGGGGGDQPPPPQQAQEDEGEPLGDFYAFPTVQQLGAATEQALRDMGFGYRAKFIAGSVAALAEKEGGPNAYLRGLREDTPYREAQKALAELPGVGPKVAACVCLFSLDKHAAIPVDTHVWQLAVEHYTPGLEGKSLTPRVMDEVQEAIVNVFGEYAGWAHNTLFIAELAHVRAALPEELRTPPRPKVVKSKSPPASSGEKKKKKTTTTTNKQAAAAAAAGEEEEEEGAGVKGVTKKKSGVARVPEKKRKKTKAATAAAAGANAASPKVEKRKGTAGRIKRDDAEEDGLVASPQPVVATDSGPKSKRPRG